MIDTPDSAATAPRARAPLLWIIGGALAIAAVGITMRALDPAPDPTLRTQDPAVAEAREAVRALVVRDERGATVPFALPGRPHVLMVNSTSCGFCREALRDMAQLQGTGGVRGLRVVTLEGAAEGTRMLTAAGVRGAFSSGPVGEQDQVLLTFRIPGTPVLARTDSAGRIVETVPGYPGRALLERWRQVLLAE
ncbi:MAG: hypothetical protein MUF21_06535 [Gemmatimonadaceae bacterium]|nr:hypothetical protein [Gemmatimonadaceae bacterium]